MGQLFTSLGINLPLLIAQLINFILLFVLIYMFGYKRILAMLDERSKRVREGLDKAEQIKQQAAEADKAFRAQMDRARKEAQGVLAQASQMAERVREEARQEAKKEADIVIARARNEIQRERDETVEALRREFADIAILAAEKVIQERLDEEANRRIVERILQESTGLRTT
ncbi:MAG: F0F1 ATP synthase subunit B [Chloroflexi bacterium]|nr:F0F1 ATP synthase subunit B [Chloroflexota bacterium]